MRLQNDSTILTVLGIVFVQLGGVIASNIYRQDDKPKYHRGNRQLIAINVLSILLFIIAKIYYVTKNKIRDKKWNAMTVEVSLPLVHFMHQFSCEARRDVAKKEYLLTMTSRNVKITQRTQAIRLVAV